MTEIKILLDPVVFLCYNRLADRMGIRVEQILSDALFKLAGELALESQRPDSPSEFLS